MWTALQKGFYASDMVEFILIVAYNANSSRIYTVINSLTAGVTGNDS